MKLKSLVVLATLFISFQVFATLKVSMIPYKITGGLSYEQLEAKVEGLVSSAMKAKPQLIVFPELVSFDLLAVNPGDNVSDPLKQHAAYFDNYVNFTKSLAKKFKVGFVAGSFQRVVDGKILNTAIYIAKNGDVTFQDKIFLTPWEAKQGWHNGTNLRMFEIEGVKSVILICHDAEFPVISQALSKIKPELIIVPSMTDDVYGHARVTRTAMARAIEHMSYVLQIGTTSVPKASWHTYYGNAALLKPQNSALGLGELSSVVGEEVASVVELDFKLLRNERKKASHIYPARDQNARLNSIVVESQLVKGAQ